MRSVLIRFCALLLRLFFRRIEVVGRHHVPTDGALVFAGNHANGLLDPLMLLCKSERRISFLAKAPLFHTPLIGWFVRSFECLPVYRAQDQQDPKKNRAVVERAIELLGRGNALGLFPEGVSHNDPSLRPFKTGAARLALAARAAGGGAVHLVPLCLYYEQKQTFRSRAVLAFGAPIGVPEVQLDDVGQPPRDVAAALTEDLKAAIEALAPTASTVDAIALAERAERILDADGRDGHRSSSLADRMASRRRLLDAYTRLVVRDSPDTALAIERLRDLALDFEARGLPLDALSSQSPTLRRAQLSRTIWLIALGPLAALGALLHAPAYQLIRVLSERYAGAETDVVATMKLVGGLLLFPGTWLAAAGLGAAVAGVPGLTAGLLAAPISGACALEALDILGWLQRQRERSAGRDLADFSVLAERRRRLADDLRALLGQAETGS